MQTPRRTSLTGIATGALSLLILSASSSQAQIATVDYQKQVHPILAAKCLSCHSDEKRAGGLTLASYAAVLQGGRNGAAVKPGKAADSLLIRRIDGSVQPVMPLGKEALAPSEVAIVRTWIDEGARATITSAAARPKWEAPLTLERPAVPQQTWENWNAPLDRFVSAYLQQRKIAEPKSVADQAFARRVYLDIWGLLPAPDELQAFLKDTNPDKRQKLVEKLLADNQKYSENWISFWNDLLRNDEGVGYAGSRKSITEWLLPSLQNNLPYNQFVTKLLNPSAATDPEGFLVGVNWRGDINASQTPYMQAAQNTAQIFLGVNLKCNSCHDSFISKWKLKDAYALASYFAPEQKLELFRCDNATGQYAEPGFLFPQLNQPSPSPSLPDRHATVAAIFTDQRNGRLARTVVNRFWERFFGRAIVDPPDEMDGEPWNPELLDWLASDFVDHGYDMKHLLATILASRTYQMPSVARNGEQPNAYVFRGPEVRRITAEQFADAIGAITGEWRVYQPQNAKVGVYSREWHVAASPLTRAMGRPIRDQVVSVRNSDATTLQALELVNGEKLTHWLTRGSKKLLGELPPEPAALFDSGNIRKPPQQQEMIPTPFDLDISQLSKLWFLVQDIDSYEPEKVEPVWGNVELVKADGSAVKLSTLKAEGGLGLRISDNPLQYKGSTGDGVRVTAPSRVAYDISGKGFVRLRGVTVIEKPALRDDIQPNIRFFIFGQEPNMERLVKVAPGSPRPMPDTLTTTDQVVNRVFWYALGRAPNARERRLAENAIADPASPGKPVAAGIADLLWAVLMTPEFQMIS